MKLLHQKVLPCVLVLSLVLSPLAQASAKIDSNGPFAIENKEEERGIVLAPIISFILPGADQWYEGQYGYGATYTTLGAAGLLYYLNNSHKADGFNGPVLAAQLYQTMGSYSAYHAFRSAVHSRPNDFSFLGSEDTPLEIALAPFDFSHIVKPTTFVPLLILGGLLTYLYIQYKGRPNVTGTGLGQTFGASYMAGTGEEALFRGWIYPALVYGLDSQRTANVVQALLFALAHYPAVQFPIIQGALGYYFGWLSAENNYSIALETVRVADRLLIEFDVMTKWVHDVL